MKPNGQRAFTLLELVTVLAILLILVAILYPVFQRTKKNASPITCRSNLKQMGLGYMQYTQDYGEKGPQVGGTGPTGGAWSQTIFPYVKSVQIFQCVDMDSSNDENLATNHSIYFYYNSLLASQKIDKVKEPPRTLLFGEGEAASANYACSSLDSCIGFNEAGPVAAVPEAAKTRHTEGANYAFADGHVKWIKPEKVSVRPGRNVSISFALR